MAYFFLTDDHVFANRLIYLLSRYEDHRLVYTSVPVKKRPAVSNAVRRVCWYEKSCAQFNRFDAGYTATDHVLAAAKKEAKCSWITVTNADNAYGSDIVRSIRQSNANTTDMLLLPTNSRNFVFSGTISAYCLRADDVPWRRASSSQA